MEEYVQGPDSRASQHGEMACQAEMRFVVDIVWQLLGGV